MIEPTLQKEEKKKRKSLLKDKVILIINGLSESGRMLAGMLAEQGSDVAVVDFMHNPPLAQQICRDVEARGQRCLVMTSDTSADDKKPFLQTAMHQIIDTLGGLDTFISYSAPDSSNPSGMLPSMDQDDNGRNSKKELFDEDGLTIAALRQIHAQKFANE